MLEIIQKRKCEAESAVQPGIEMLNKEKEPELPPEGWLVSSYFILTSCTSVQKIEVIRIKILACPRI